MKNLLPVLTFVLAAPVWASNSVTLTPTTLAFGNQPEGTTSAALPATLTNGKSTPLTITSIAVSGNYIQTGSTCPLSPNTLAANASCTIQISFTPKALGGESGTLTVTDSSSGSPQTAKLTGKGTAPVTLSPTSLTFAKLPLDETSPAKTVTLTNNQNVTLNFTRIMTSGDFAVASSTCGASIAALESCVVGVTFTPTATGTRTGNLTFTDSATGSPQTVSLTGTGGAAALLSITVTPANSTLFYVGATEQLTATGNYSNNTTKNLTNTAAWATNPTGIATVSSSGLATGAGVGTTTVSATSNGVTGQTQLTVQQSFFTTGSLNEARYYHTATMLDNGNVLLAGGIGPVNTGQQGALGELNSAELYNPTAGTFGYTGNLVTARDLQSATLLNNGTVLLVGGSGGDGYLASAEIYNPATGAFTTTGSLTTARYQHTANQLPNGSVLIAGGYGEAGVLASAEIYNPATGTFTVSTSSLNNARFDATATLLPNGTVLIAGGANAAGALASAEIYNPLTGTFTPTSGSLNTARSSATATLLNSGEVLIADGYNYATTGPLTTAELFNPATGTFSYTGSVATSGWLGTATLLTNSQVLIAGSIYNTSDAELYNPAGTGTFTESGPLLTPGDLQTATLLLNGNVLVAGGFSSGTNSVLAASELYEPATLTPPNLVSIAISPTNPTLTVGGATQFIAIGTFSDNSTQQLTGVIWSSSNPAAATITNDSTNSGSAYGVAAGATVITACAGSVCGSTQPLTVP